MTAEPVAGLLLAAGAGRRYGRPKALVESAGRLLVDRAVVTLRAGGCEPVVVVLGAAAERIRVVAAELAGCVVVENSQWRSGMGSSLRAGLSALAARDEVAALVMLVDQPGITAAAVRRVAAPANRQALVMAGYGQRRGHPVLLGRAHWAGVMAVAVGEVGAREYLRHRATAVRVVPCADVADDRDVDGPEHWPSR